MALGGGAIQTMDNTPPPAPVPDIPASLCLGEGELDRLLRFQKRTALSIGHGRGSRVFQDLSMDIAFTVRLQRTNFDARCVDTVSS